jgi:hypothetical protein
MNNTPLDNYILNVRKVNMNGYIMLKECTKRPG